ncbi:hypothetical protein BDQ17DRAFT_915403 [Cyathus striatus]|nr:hypothetical protein BDQ17DRAFT_915403 [Cyathus striatus]
MTTIQAPQPHRPKPAFQLLHMPKGSMGDNNEWWEGGSVSSDDTTEYQLNLGAETPTSEGSSIPVDQWASSSASALTPASASSSSYAPKKREWTIIAGNGYEEKDTTSTTATIDEWRTKETLQREREKNGKKAVKDRDCGICFEYAVEPCRTLCCGKIFCREHIADWLEGPSSNGLCPACELPCSFEAGTVPLSTSSSSPTIRQRSGTVTKTSYTRTREGRSASPPGLRLSTCPTRLKDRSPSPIPYPADSTSSSSSTTTSPATTIASTASTIEQWEQIQDADVGVSFSPLKVIGRVGSVESHG